MSALNLISSSTDLQNKLEESLNLNNKLATDIILFLFYRPYSTIDDISIELKIENKDTINNIVNLLKESRVIRRTYNDNAVNQYYLEIEYFKKVISSLNTKNYHQIFNFIDGIEKDNREENNSPIFLNEHEEILESNILAIIKILDDLPSNLSVAYEIHNNILKGGIRVKIFQHHYNMKSVSFPVIKLEIFQDNNGILQYKIKSGKERVVLSNFEKVVELIQSHFETLTYLSSLVQK